MAKPHETPELTPEANGGTVAYHLVQMIKYNENPFAKVLHIPMAIFLDHAFAEKGVWAPTEAKLEIMFWEVSVKEQNVISMCIEKVKIILKKKYIVFK